MMKPIAIIANVILMAVMIFYVIRDIGSIDVTELLLIQLFLITPILSIVALTRTSGSNFITLWFKRKTLEEERKIKDLSDK